MISSKILVQVNSSFDLYILTAIVRDSRNRFVADLLVPNNLLEKIPTDVRASYGEIYGFTPGIKNFFSLAAIHESLRLTRWAKNSINKYHAVIFGAYRSDITSLLARHFCRGSVLLAIKQGIDIPQMYYKRYLSINEIHDNFYFRLFGFSSFWRERLVQDNAELRRSDYFFMRPVWKKDPFLRDANVFTIGVPQNAFNDGTPFLMPNFELIQGDQRKNLPKQGILIVGERTPMTPSWGQTQDALLRKFFTLLLGTGEKIYVRGRKNLTNNVFYSQLDPIFLDPDQLYDDQLLKLNPRLVISVKSTAIKVAAYYGYDALLLYPCMNFEPAEQKHLDYLFGDGAPLERVGSLQQLSAIISRGRMQHSVDREFSQRSLDFFFERLNRGLELIS